MKRRPQQYVMKLLKRTNPMAFSCLCIFNNKSPLLSLKCSSQYVPSHPDFSLSLLWRSKPFQTKTPSKCSSLQNGVFGLPGRAAGRASKLTFHLKIWQPHSGWKAIFSLILQHYERNKIFKFLLFTKLFFPFLKLCQSFRMIYYIIYEVNTVSKVWKVFSRT